MKKIFLGLVLVSMVFSACGLTENSTEVIEMDSDLLDQNEGQFQEEEILENEEVYSSEGQDDGVGYFSLSDISKHSEKDDCWFVINYKVYDVSTYKAHPGADAIYEGCGKDATELFETRPMGSGTAHSERARGFLENYYIGELLP